MELKLGYKKTDVGVIPEDWDIKPIRSVCTLINGRGFKPFEWQKSGLPIIRIQNLNGSDDFNYFKGNYDKKLEVEPDQLLFAWSGSRGTSFGPHVWSGPLGLLNYHTWKVQIKEAEIDKDFFLYALKNITSYIEDKAHGASALVHTQKWEMEGFEFIAPSDIAEQRAIATALSDVDALLAKLDQLITKKRDLKQATMQQLLTGQIRLPEFSDNLGYKHTELGMIPVTWNVCYLIDLSRFINGRAYNLTEWETSGTPVIRLQNLTGGTEYYYSSLRLPPQQYCDHGDLLYMWSATFGPHIWRGEKAIYHYHIWKVEPRNEECDKFFLYYKLGEITEKLKQRSTNGGTMLHFTKANMEKTLVIAPSLFEQTAIATVLSSMDAEITALESRRDKTRDLKQGMMQELLTGRIRLV